LLLISFKEDMLFRNSEMKKIDTVLQNIGKTNHTYIDIDSDYGHDAFLVELEKFDFYIQEVLNGK
jgi:homoserine O-acetyltransferase